MKKLLLASVFVLSLITFLCFGGTLGKKHGASLMHRNITALTQDETPPQIDCIDQDGSTCDDTVYTADGTCVILEFEDMVRQD